jgi:hypothetical protein
VEASGGWQRSIVQEDVAILRYLALAVVLLGAACGGGPTGPLGLVRFADRDIKLGEGLSGQIQLTNVGSEPLSGVTFKSNDPVNSSGDTVDGARLNVLTGTLGFLDPGRKLSFPILIKLKVSGIAPGSYSIELMVLVDGEESDRATIRFVRPKPRDDPRN